ncbi:MAG: hypothetical protein BWK78_08050 [Thiotrichaceae bacterium IS1]|nr:MAG: hypothetical protein BWK78_08050 [Thiotrichaceae bacterium IS1]
MNVIAWYMVSSSSYGWVVEEERWKRDGKGRFVTVDRSEAEFEMIFAPHGTVMTVFDTTNIGTLQ